LNELARVFDYQGRQVRTLIKGGEPWWVAKDVCDVLDIGTEQLRRLDDDEKQTLQGKESLLPLTQDPNITQLALVNEAGLYSLILGSRKPEAKDFKRWVTHEVIPQIRKTGAYSLDPRKLLATAVIEAQKIIEEQDKKIKEMLPKAEFYDAVAGSKDAIDIGSAAKVLDMGIGRNKLFEILRNKGVLMSNNIPYQKYIDCGYFRTIEQKYSKPDGTVCINIKTLVYQKGLDFIRKLLKEDNVVALRRVSKEQTA
jgi:prophage antirepressor-like protein